MSDFLSALQERVLVCDGAMGTMLYNKGVFISRCFDELNLSNPALVREIHLEYAKAGADIVETNTFGGNRAKLMPHGLADMGRQINIAGACVAREAAGEGIFVAGSIGPLGIRIEPWGRTGIDEAREIFREQAQALLEGGVDLFILETFCDLNEVRAAVLGVRDVSTMPIVAQMSIEENGNSREGTPPEVFAKRLDEWGADVVGLNCSVGPHSMLDSIERLAAVTSKPLSVQPNAGKPRNVEGRNIYLCSPEYMASYARKFVQQGVRIVGGCCGTTPQHVKAMRAAVKSAKAGAAAGRILVDFAPGKAGAQPSVKVAPLEEKSRLARKLARGEFIRVVEMVPPLGYEYEGAIERAKNLQPHNIDVIDIPDAPRSSACMSALSFAMLIERSTNIETLPHYTCRDRNLLGMQADVLGAYALGLRNLLLTTGEPQVAGDYPDGTAVYDVDSIGLTNMIYRLNQGIDVGGKSIGQPTAILIGVVVNPGAIDDGEELKRFYYKVEAGAEFAVTQPVFDPAVLERFLKRIRDSKIPIVAGIAPLSSYAEAEFLHHEVPGCDVPLAILNRIRQASGPQQAKAEGIRIAQGIVTEIRGMVQGIQVRTEDHQTAVEVLSAVN